MMSAVMSTMMTTMVWVERGVAVMALVNRPFAAMHTEGKPCKWEEENTQTNAPEPSCTSRLLVDKCVSVLFAVVAGHKDRMEWPMVGVWVSLCCTDINNVTWSWLGVHWLTTSHHRLTVAWLLVLVIHAVYK